MQGQLNDLKVRVETPPDQAAIASLSRITGACGDITSERDKSYSTIWVASSQEQIVGYLVFWEVADELQLIDLATDVGWRRRGVAHSLVRRLIRHAQDCNASQIILEVRKRNSAAIALYERCGFKVSRQRANYYSDDDALEMSFEP